MAFFKWRLPGSVLMRVMCAEWGGVASQRIVSISMRQRLSAPCHMKKMIDPHTGCVKRTTEFLGWHTRKRGCSLAWEISLLFRSLLWRLTLPSRDLSLGATSQATRPKGETSRARQNT